ncbi:DUF397 domain-containing protein [Streptomyces abikoensis]
MSTPLQWFKSSYSDDSGGNCIEVAADWHKSSYSDPGGGNCVEVARRPDRAPVHIPEAPAIHVRDSKKPNGPTLTLNHSAWSTFVAYATRPHPGTGPR